MRLVIISCIPEFGESAAGILAVKVRDSFFKAAALSNCSSSGSKTDIDVETIIGSRATRSAVLDSLTRAASYTAGGPNRRAIIYYTGHGDQKQDTSRDEADGRDEFWRTRNGILDDDVISSVFAKTPTHPSSLVFLISDSCSSETMIDKSITIKSGSNWVTLSACRDRESALSTSDGGAMTLFGLIPALEKGANTPQRLHSLSQLEIPDQHVSITASKEELKTWKIFE